jgi:hypothetical protein
MVAAPDDVGGVVGVVTGDAAGEPVTVTVAVGCGEALPPQATRATIATRSTSTAGSRAARRATLVCVLFTLIFISDSLVVAGRHL